MTQYNGLNVNLSNSQLNKLKFAIENETKVVHGGVHFLCFRLEISFWASFVQKIKIVSSS